jgi:hypothetical protein
LIVGWSLEKCQRIVDTYIARSGANTDAAFAALQAHRIRQAQAAAAKANEALKAANSNDLAALEKAAESAP